MEASKTNTKECFKIMGVNFLHNHPQAEREAGLDPDHVIIDRKEWLSVIKFFEENPQYIDALK